MLYAQKLPTALRQNALHWEMDRKNDDAIASTLGILVNFEILRYVLQAFANTQKELNSLPYS